MSALSFFLGRPTYYRGVGTVQWTVPATITLDIKKNQAVAWFLCVCVGYLPGQANVLFCLQVSGGHLQAEKSPNLSVEALCSRYLSFWVGQRIVVAQEQSSGLFQPQLL